MEYCDCPTYDYAVASEGLVSESYFAGTDGTNEVSGRVYSDGLPYATIQEFGGQTKALIIEAKKGKALMLRLAASKSSRGG